MCTVKSLITTFVEMQLKRENLEKVLWAQTGNELDTPLQKLLATFQNYTKNQMQ